MTLGTEMEVMQSGTILGQWSRYFIRASDQQPRHSTSDQTGMKEDRRAIRKSGFKGPKSPTEGVPTAKARGSGPESEETKSRH